MAEGFSSSRQIVECLLMEPRMRTPLNGSCVTVVGPQHPVKLDAAATEMQAFLDFLIECCTAESCGVLR